MSYPGKGRADYQVEGDWNVRCSMCGFKRFGSQLVRNWQGMWRCPEHNEPRQPQDFVRAVPDNPTPPYTQPGGQTFVFAGQMIATEGSDLNIPTFNLFWLTDESGNALETES